MRNVVPDDVARYKTKLLEELEFMWIMADRNNSTLAPGLQAAIELIEGEQPDGR